MGDIGGEAVEFGRMGALRYPEEGSKNAVEGRRQAMTMPLLLRAAMTWHQIMARNQSLI